MLILINLEQVELPDVKNPLLEIDLRFSSYLAAKSRSSGESPAGNSKHRENKPDRIDDYAYGPDYSSRLKIINMSGWAKIYKRIVSVDIPDNYKRIFKSASLVSNAVYPNVLSAAQICSKRLRVNTPEVYVRNSASADAYSLFSPQGVFTSGSEADSCIVITSKLYESCSHDELVFFIGRECGRLYNEHSAYLLLSSLLEKTPADKKGSVNKFETALSSWRDFADITADRAGIIALDDPFNFQNVYHSACEKEIIECDIAAATLDDLHGKTIKTPIRNIMIPKEYTPAARRFIAGMEFLYCDVLYKWRSDVDKSDIITMDKQALEARCGAIVGV